jgi:prepilin-type processing-associated H-X9-DG protein
VRFAVRRMMVVVAGWLASASAVVAGAVWAVSAMRAGADREMCRDHLKQIGVALDNYVSVHGCFPYGAVPSAAIPVGRRLGWHATLLDFIEGNGPNIPDKARAWDDPAVTALVRFDKEAGRYEPAGSEISTYRCPAGGAAHFPAGRQPTEYVGVAGLGADAPMLPLGHPRAGVFGHERATPGSRITDGLGSTMAVVETREDRGPWRAGGPSTVKGLDPSRRPYVGAGRQFGGLHPGGAQVVFADGSVRFVRDSIDPAVFEAMATIAGGEPLPPGWDH